MRNLEKYVLKQKHPRSYFYKVFKEHFLLTREAFMMPVPNITEEIISYNKIYLPTLKPGIKKTLVFDLDECLIHTIKEEEKC